MKKNVRKRTKAVQCVADGVTPSWILKNIDKPGKCANWMVQAETDVRYFTKEQIEEAYNRGQKAGLRTIARGHIERLPRDTCFPIDFTLPPPRDGWVRCVVCAGIYAPGERDTLICVDVPQQMHDNLPTVRGSFGLERCVLPEESGT